MGQVYMEKEGNDEQAPKTGVQLAGDGFPRDPEWYWYDDIRVR